MTLTIFLLSGDQKSKTKGSAGTARRKLFCSSLPAVPRLVGSELVSHAPPLPMCPSVPTLPLITRVWPYRIRTHPDDLTLPFSPDDLQRPSFQTGSRSRVPWGRTVPHLGRRSSTHNSHYYVEYPSFFLLRIMPQRPSKRFPRIHPISNRPKLRRGQGSSEVSQSHWPPALAGKLDYLFHRLLGQRPRGRNECEGSPTMRSLPEPLPTPRGASMMRSYHRGIREPEMSPTPVPSPAAQGGWLSC